MGAAVLERGEVSAPGVRGICTAAEEIAEKALLGGANEAVPANTEAFVENEASAVEERD